MDIPFPKSMQYFSNMPTKRILFHALWLVWHNSNILSSHHSDSRSTQLDHQTNVLFSPLHQYILVCKWKVQKVDKFRKLRIQFSWSCFHQAKADQSPEHLVMYCMGSMEYLEIWHHRRLLFWLPWHPINFLVTLLYFWDTGRILITSLWLLNILKHITWLKH